MSGFPFTHSELPADVQNFIAINFRKLRQTQTIKLLACGWATLAGKVSQNAGCQ
jgi:hypothetical protein